MVEIFYKLRTSVQAEKWDNVLMAIALPKKLTPRQERFVAEYVVRRNGAAAARRAGYSAKSAKVTASRLLTDANVLAELAVQQRTVQAQLDVTRLHAVNDLKLAIALAHAHADPHALIKGWRQIAKICGYCT